VGTMVKAEASGFEIATNLQEGITCGKSTLNAEVQGFGTPMSLGVQYAFSGCSGPVATSCTATSAPATGTLSYNSD